MHKGEHPAIVDRDVFDRVQAMLAERSVARTLKRESSPHLLTGLMSDDRGNPMSPTHANKKGVRYRYYTSHALLQHRKEHAGSVSRVSAPEVEALVCEALRQEGATADGLSEKDLMAQHVSKVIVRRAGIELEIRSDADREELGLPNKVVIPFNPASIPQKGITREPKDDGFIGAIARDSLLNAITRASAWVEAVKSGQAKSFPQIAAREGLGERHLRRLAVLAFLSPNLLNAVANCTGTRGTDRLVVTEALPHCWANQEAFLG